MENWRVIEGYPDYEVSDLGRVRSKKCGPWIIMKPGYCYGDNINNPYAIIGLVKDGKKKTFILHRLIGKAFIPNPKNKPTIDHINKKRLDNRLVNLRWATRREQQANRTITHGSSGIPYIKCNNHGNWEVKVRGYGQKTLKTLEEAIKVRDMYLAIKNISILENDGD